MQGNQFDKTALCIFPDIHGLQMFIKFKSKELRRLSQAITLQYELGNRIKALNCPLEGMKISLFWDNSKKSFNPKLSFSDALRVFLNSCPNFNAMKK